MQQKFMQTRYNDANDVPVDDCYENTCACTFLARNQLRMDWQNWKSGNFQKITRNVH
jgi:hypothetical protein